MSINSPTEVKIGGVSRMFQTAEAGSKSSFAQLMLEFEDNEEETDRFQQNEVLPGSTKTKYAMKFKLDTDKHLIESNRVSRILILILIILIR